MATVAVEQINVLNELKFDCCHTKLIDTTNVLKDVNDSAAAMTWDSDKLCLIFQEEHEKNKFMTDRNWWKKTIIYQIYPRSFCDSNGDGVGDLRGIISKLDYIKDLGVNCVWLNPIYLSPMRDCGYDVSDYTAIDPIFGTMDDFDELVEGLHRRGIKLLMDYIPNHTSNEHKWFQESAKSADPSNPYRDYYVWHDGYQDGNGGHWPPNNWLSVFGGTMWEWNENRKQFYLHQFLPEMPDLNYRCPAVLQEMENVLSFWLDHGVDGFRVDAIKHLFEAENVFQDEEKTHRENTSDDQYESLRHRYTIDQPEIASVLASWRGLLDSYSKSTGHYRFMVAEVYEDWDTSLDTVMSYYDMGCDAPFNFQLVTNFHNHTGGWGLRHIVENWLTRMPDGRWPIWALGNHDNPRIADKFGSSHANALNLLLLLLPGTPVTYYGEELGMEGKQVSFEETQDSFCKRFGPDRYHFFSRDPARGPMLWDGSDNAGFTSSVVKPWLPPHDNYREHNAEEQANSKHTSPLKLYRDLAILRQEPAFQVGTIEPSYTSHNLYSFIRRVPSSQLDNENTIFRVDEDEQLPSYRYHVCVNVGRDPDCIDTPGSHLLGLHDGDEASLPKSPLQRPCVVIHTNNLRPDQTASLTAFPFKPLSIYPGQAFVIRSVEPK